MTEKRTAPLDETLLSGYLDGELTQAEGQRVRLAVENDPRLKATYEEMRRMREASMSTTFRMPDDTQWDERPRGALSLASRGAGWLLVSVWLAVTAGFGLWQLAIAPESLWLKLGVFGGLAGVALLFVSVLLDRLREAPADRYRRVEK